jgi:hypothetical protein
MIYTDYPTQSPFVKQTSYDLRYAFTQSASKSIHVAKTEVAVVNTVIVNSKPRGPGGGAAAFTYRMQ